LEQLPLWALFCKNIDDQPKMLMPEMVTIDQDEIASPHAQEVEFALLLSRMINTIKQDPEQLRLTIYDFARTKLKADMSWAGEDEKRRLLASLETAIKGVEKFSLRTDQTAQLNPPSAAPQLALGGSAPTPRASSVAGVGQADVQTYPREPLEIRATSTLRSYPVRRSRANTTSFLLFGFGGLLVGSLLIAGVYLQHTVAMRGPVEQSVPAPPHSAAAAADAPSFPIPTDYGVYALNNGKLSELDALSEQVPDKRVAMSTPVTKPSRTTLPDGQARFVVFRRDLAGNAPDRVDVRVVARVTRELTFDQKGKATILPVEDAWNIRNVTYGFRVRPIPGNPEMLLMQPENANFVLPAGRYVLVLKNIGYDFTVAGNITDPAQCLERTEAANGVFYSDCVKP
jgi:hypothetical protein